MTKVKICGITNLDDGLFAANEGADALGFNFYRGSPRYITPVDAGRIISDLPSKIEKIGVFVNETAENISETAALAGLDAIQLHGDETPEFALKLREKTDLTIIKALRVSTNFRLSDVLAYEADAILLDAFSRSGYGGTGETFDWEIARQVQNLVKTYLAGGLTPDNVKTAVRSVSPFGVDACSGLERTKGLKDNLKVRAFIEAAKGIK